MDNCIPHSVLKPRKNLPWLTKTIIQAMRKRNSLFRAAHKSGNKAILSKYKAERNKVVSLLRASKTAYFQNLGSSNSKEFWKAVKLVNKRSSTIPALKDGSFLITTDTEKAQLLNDFSTAVLTVLLNHWVILIHLIQATVHLIYSALKIKSQICYSHSTQQNPLDLTAYLQCHYATINCCLYCTQPY